MMAKLLKAHWQYLILVKVFERREIDTIKAFILIYRIYFKAFVNEIPLNLVSL